MHHRVYCFRHAKKIDRQTDRQTPNTMEHQTLQNGAYAQQNGACEPIAIIGMGKCLVPPIQQSSLIQ